MKPNRKMRRKKRLSKQDLITLTDYILDLPPEDQIQWIQKENPYWKMPEDRNTQKPTTN